LCQNNILFSFILLAGCRRDKGNDKVQGFAGQKSALPAVKEA